MARLQGVFAHEGEYWTVVFDGRVSRLRHTKGMGYLAELLRRPGEELHALELAGATATGASDGDVGAVLDEAAIAAYRQMAADLESEIEEADAYGDPERAADARLELDALVGQLAGGLGLGGRRRRAGSTSERARVAVTKALKSAVARIGEAEPELGRHLTHAVRTGTFCSYRPDAEVELTWAERAPLVTAPVARRQLLARRRVPFVGRERELEELRRRQAEAAAGAGSFVLVGGDPGIGKSRLIDELADSAEQLGMALLIGRCRETESSLAYLPFVEVLEAIVDAEPDEALEAVIAQDAAEIARLVPRLRRRFPELPPAPDLPAAQARRLLFAAVCDVLARLSEERPRLLVVEDVHWADEATLSLLEHVTGHLATLHLLVVATYRLAEAPVGSPLAQLTARLLSRPDVLRLTLAPLNPGEVAALVAALHGSAPPERLLERIGRDTGGNPFFVEELYQHLADQGALEAHEEGAGLPDSVRLVLGHRLQRLSRASREALALAAVSGRDFDEALLLAAGAEQETLLDGLDEALAARLLAVARNGGAGDRYRFVHALVREALLSALSPARRRSLHALLAEAIETLHGDDPVHAVELADHLEAAGPGIDAARFVRAQQRAARRLLQAAAFEEALARLEAAVVRCPPGDDPLRRSVLADRGYAHRSLGGMEAAFVDWRAALAGAGRSDGDRVLSARVCCDAARTLDMTGRLDEAVSFARQGLSIVGGERSHDQGALLSALGHALSLRGEYDEAERALDEAHAIADELDDVPLRGDVLASLAVLHFTRADRKAAAQVAADAVEPLLASGDLWGAAQATVTPMLNAICLGRIAEVEAVADEARLLCDRAGHTAADAWRRRSLAAIELMRSGDLACYAEFAASDLAFCREHQLRWIADVLVNSGMCAFWRGDWMQAAAHLEEAAAIAPPPPYVGRYSSALLVLHAWAGDEEAFLRHRDRVEHELAAAAVPGLTLGRETFLLSALEACAVLGRFDDAAALGAEAEDALARDLVLRASDLRLVTALAALAAASAGDFAVAEQQLAAARALVRNLPHRRDEPDLDFFAGFVFEWGGRPGDRRRAREAYAVAKAGYERLHMPRHAQLARSRG